MQAAEIIFVTDEIEQKTQRLVELLDRQNLGGILLNGQHNFAWLTAGRSNGIDLSRDNGAAFLLVRPDGKRFVIANNIEMPRLLAEEISSKDFEPVEIAWQAEKVSAGYVIESARRLIEQGAELAADIPLHSGTRAIDDIIARCRYSLTEEETSRYRDLGKEAGKAMRAVIDKLKPGESEIEIAAKVRTELWTFGINSIVTLAAADERIARFRHPLPTENRWRKTLLMVTCAKRGGLIASLSRIICVGAVPDDLMRKTEAAAYVNACLLAATQPGATGTGLYNAAARAYIERGFANEIDLHHQGGATGYRTRDWVAHPKCTETVQASQAFAWNPSLTGTKVEETFIVTDSGPVVITESPDFPRVLTVVDGREYFSPGVLSL